MLLKKLTLQNFRNYTKSQFSLNSGINVIIGQNATGKSNFLESVFLLAAGKSFQAEKDEQMVEFGHEFGRITGVTGDEETVLEVVIAETAKGFFRKKYFVNQIPRRRADFAGLLKAVLFTPADLEIVIGEPGDRRRFLDDSIEQVDLRYMLALSSYVKALRQRNALLEQTREQGFKNEKQFAYWDDLLIENGGVITQKREELINYINKKNKQMFGFEIVYDKSVISVDRLKQYEEAETGAGVTLVGPHRDDLLIFIKQGQNSGLKNAKFFGSRGQQRLVVLELKLLQISYIEEQAGVRPVLLLDDIFSELDSAHIKEILGLVYKQQTIITTTHEEFIDSKIGHTNNVINL